MAVVANKRSIMTFYSDALDIYCHRVRIVLAEKGVNVEIIDVNLSDKPEDLAQLNPYNSVPTLVDRDLVIYESRIIMEYLDERFPHPPLMPVYPVARAENRQLIFRIDRELYSLFHNIHNAEDENVASLARKRLREAIISLEPVFNQKSYFLADEFSMVDCCMGALLWRLPRLGIDVHHEIKAIQNYCQRVFDRKSFRESLSEAEQELCEEAYG